MTRRAAQRRYDVQALIDAGGLSSNATMRAVKAGGGRWTMALQQGISEATADRWATRLGFVPYEIWPEMVDHLVEDEGAWVTCAADDCPQAFDPQASSKKKRRFCSRTCQTRVNKRRQRTNPAQRERDREARRRYQAEVRELQARRAS